MFDLSSPRDSSDLATSLEKQGVEIEGFFSSLAESEFFAAQGEYWSPAEHLRHLIKSVRPVVQALEAPKLALRLRFGRSRRGSRTYDEVVASYRQSLAEGATAGPYAPSEGGTDRAADEWRREILERWAALCRQFLGAFESWDDRSLDRYRLPHPLLGKMTVREILFFTLYHNAHHARRVAERRSGPGREMP